MRSPRFPLSPVARACATSLLCGTLVGLGAHAFAATAAGQSIKNIATVTYEDAAGNVYTAESNEAVVTVAQVYSSTIGVDNDKQAAPGETVYLPYELTNTGNGTDLFEVSVVDGSTGSNLASVNRTVYLDSDGNGRPDDGEPVLTTLSIDAGESADIVVAVQIPVTATTGQIGGIKLTARARNGTGAFVATSVDDLSPGNGRDAIEGTVESRVTITNDAVLALTKTSSHDIANNRITYTLSVTNTGNTVARDVVLFDGIPAGTAIARLGGVPIVADSGLLAGNLDTDAFYTDTLSESGDIRFNLDADDIDATEAAIGLDLDSDGTLSAAGAVPGVYARDEELAPNATLSLTFTVEYDPAVLGGGTEILNTAHLTADIDDSGTLAATDLIDSSTRTSDTVAFSYAVGATDTDGVAPTDSQVVASTASGGVAEFDIVIANGGNADDSFELTVDQDAANTFPTGTVFTFYDSTGTTKLIDDNGLGGIDTGVIAAGASRTVRVRANLPQGVSGDNGGAGFAANVRAVSAGDPSVTALADFASTASIDLVEIVLGQIVAASADIHASTGGIDASDEDPLTTPPKDGVVATITADAGTSVDIPVFIDNESGLSDSYQLSAGSSLDAGGVLGGLPDGWSVQFFLTDDPNGDGSGTLTQAGGAISSVTVPAGRLDYPIIARVTISPNAAQAAADVDHDIDADPATDDSIDQNADGDGDYPLFLRIFSPTTDATDTVLEAIDINASRAVAFTPSASNQAELGGTVDYPLTLSNDGNSVETLELTSSNSQPGFTNTVLIDTDGDGTPDTVLGNLVGAGPAFVPVAPIDVRLTDGTVVTITVENADGDEFPELVLPPGIDLPLLATVFAPASAPPSQVDTMTLVAINTDPAFDALGASVAFQTGIVDGNVRLIKTVAVDANCDGDNLDAAVGAFNADSGFATVQSVRVEPGECALWRIVAENQGDADALNVFVTDAVTPFSDFLVGSLRGCIGNGCTPIATPSADVFASENASVIRFNVGPGADATDGGTLIPGQKATVQFGVTVR